MNVSRTPAAPPLPPGGPPPTGRPAGSPTPPTGPADPRTGGRGGPRRGRVAQGMIVAVVVGFGAGVAPDGGDGAGGGSAARASETQGPAAVAPPAADVGPVAYRGVRREALRLRRVGTGDADGADAPPDLGAPGRWRPVPRGPTADALAHAADAALLADLEAADGSRRAFGRTPAPAPPPPPGADRGPAPPATTSWWLVATWEAAALVNLGTEAAPIPRIARARRVVAAPLPPPDLGPPPRTAGPPWPAAWCALPAPHPDAGDGRGRDRGEPGGRGPGRARRGGSPDVAPADAFSRGIARARAGDPVGALAWFARADDGAPGGRAAADALPFAALRRRLWAAEVRLAVGRAAEAVDDLATATALVAGTTAVPTATARAAVIAFVAERAAVAAWRADAARRATGLASAGIAGRTSDGTRRGKAPGAGPALDARGDATLAWPPVDAADADDGGAGEATLASARRRTAAWWRGRRR